MNVTCDACKTIFKVDDSRIPPEGIKVRCSKCQQVFLVRREASGDFLSELHDFERSLRDRMEEASSDTADEQPTPIGSDHLGAWANFLLFGWVMPGLQKQVLAPPLIDFLPAFFVPGRIQQLIHARFKKTQMDVGMKTQ